MPSIKARFMNLIFKFMPSDPPGVPHDYVAERKRNDRKPPRTPQGITVTDIKLNGIHAEKIEKADNGEYLVLYIHGGGFTTGSARERRGITQYITLKFGINCVAFDYRLAPDNKFPAQLEDCLTAYCAVLKMGHEANNIILAGESAGGTLALTLALKLKELGLPQPAAILSISPVTNFADDLPSHKANIKKDFMLKQDVANPQQLHTFLGEDISRERLLNPYISPYFGDYEGLPPICFITSDYEVMYDDARLLYERLKSEGKKVALEVKHGMCHAYPAFTQLKESRESLAVAFSFILGIFGCM